MTEQPTLSFSADTDKLFWPIAGNVILETVKRAEDENGTIIRMYESENSLTKAKVTVNADFTKAYVCNLLEETESEAEVNGKEISVVLKPYEVVTLKLV